MGIFQTIKQLFTGSQSQVIESPKEIRGEEAASTENSKGTNPGIYDAEFEPGEKELVAAIASAGLAGSRSDVLLNIVSVKKVDQDMLAAGIIASAVVAGDQPDSHYRIKKVYRISNN